MANTIAKAIGYITEPDGIAKSLDYSLKTKDLEVANIAVGAQTVKYQHIEFDDYDLGTYNATTGYANKGIQLSWKEKTLSQDKGDSLDLDVIDDEEAMANGIVKLGNRYVDRVQNPCVDKYRLGVIKGNTHANVVNSTLTSSNIVAKLLAGRTFLVNNHISLANTILYISASADALLEEAAFGKGYITVGTWNGQLDTQVRMFKEAKKVVVPDDYFGDLNVQAILLNPEACPAMKKWNQHDYIPALEAFGKRKSRIILGIYHDAWVYDELARGIVVFLKTTGAGVDFGVTYAAGNASATGNAPTQADVAPGGTFTLADNTFSLTGKTFVGWDDGANLYKAGATYSMPNAAVTLTARWK